MKAMELPRMLAKIDSGLVGRIRRLSDSIKKQEGLAAEQRILVLDWEYSEATDVVSEDDPDYLREDWDDLSNVLARSRMLIAGALKGSNAPIRKAKKESEDIGLSLGWDSAICKAVGASIIEGGRLAQDALREALRLLDSFQPLADGVARYLCECSSKQERIVAIIDETEESSIVKKRRQSRDERNWKNRYLVAMVAALELKAAAEAFLPIALKYVFLKCAVTIEATACRTLREVSARIRTPLSPRIISANPSAANMNISSEGKYGELRMKREGRRMAARDDRNYDDNSRDDAELKSSSGKNSAGNGKMLPLRNATTSSSSGRISSLLQVLEEASQGAIMRVKSKARQLRREAEKARRSELLYPPFGNEGGGDRTGICTMNDLYAVLEHVAYCCGKRRSEGDLREEEEESGGGQAPTAGEKGEQRRSQSDEYDEEEEVEEDDDDDDLEDLGLLSSSSSSSSDHPCHP